MPDHLQRLIEQRQGQHGIGLRELAVLVATLDYLIDGDRNQGPFTIEI